MNSETLNNLDKLNKVSQEPMMDEKHIDEIDGKKELKKKRKPIWSRFRIWLIGLIISLIPLLAVPIIKMLKGENNFGSMLHETFSSYEIIFVGISLSIAALNDFITQESKKSKEGWIWTNIVIITFGAMIYGGIAIASYYDKDIKLSGLLGFNLLYLSLIFILGTAKYWQELREVK